MVITLWSTGGNDRKAKNEQMVMYGQDVTAGLYSALPVRNCRCFHLIFYNVGNCVLQEKRQERLFRVIVKKLTGHFQKLYPAKYNELAMEQ